MAYTINSAIVKMASFFKFSNFVVFLKTWKSRIRTAGPEQNAVVKNLGASNALFQKGRAGKALYRNAVTVWIAIAAGILSKTIGKMNDLLYSFL